MVTIAGVRIIARVLRDAGMEVIYAGLHNTPEQVVAAAVQEDVAVIGISLLSGAHMTIVPRLLTLLREADAGDIPLVIGGLIPDEDVPQLLAAGVTAVIDQDDPPETIPGRIREAAAARAKSR